MTDTIEASAALTVPHLQALGTDLLLALTDVAGDPQAISALLVRWLEVLGPRDVTLVCSTALRQAFAECILIVTVVPPEEGKPE